MNMSSPIRKYNLYYGLLEPAGLFAQIKKARKLERHQPVGPIPQDGKTILHCVFCDMTTEWPRFGKPPYDTPEGVMKFITYHNSGQCIYDPDRPDNPPSGE